MKVTCRERGEGYLQRERRRLLAERGMKVTCRERGEGYLQREG